MAPIVLPQPQAYCQSPPPFSPSSRAFEAQISGIGFKSWNYALTEYLSQVRSGTEWIVACRFVGMNLKYTVQIPICIEQSTISTKSAARSPIVIRAYEPAHQAAISICGGRHSAAPSRQLPARLRRGKRGRWAGCRRIKLSHHVAKREHLRHRDQRELVCH